MNRNIVLNNKLIPKKNLKFKKLNKFSKDLFLNEKLIELKLGDKIYTGKCFIHDGKKKIYWQPYHRCYVLIEKFNTFISYDLLKNKEVRLIPTDLQLNKFYENKLKEILKRGRFHLRETKKAYVDLNELKGE